uniref:Polo kinase n=1 Tax=Ascaris lumbricoides TaxID=6252 RepID=A0A9J2PFN7_ASCLU
MKNDGFFIKSQFANIESTAFLTGNASTTSRSTTGHGRARKDGRKRSLQVRMRSADSGIASKRLSCIGLPCVVDQLSVYKEVISGCRIASDENISFTAGRTVIVTKWADYTGKIGFGCVLNDGTLCVLFTDGSSLGHRLASSCGGERYKLLANVNEQPPAIVEWERAKDVKDSKVLKKIKYAAQFELRAASSFDVVSPYVNLLLYEKRCKHALLLVLSSGVTQINFLETHEKLILWRGEHSHIYATVVHDEHGKYTCRMVRGGPQPTLPQSRLLQKLISRARRCFDED